MALMGRRSFFQSVALLSVYACLFPGRNGVLAESRRRWYVTRDLAAHHAEEEEHVERSSRPEVAAVSPEDEAFFTRMLLEERSMGDTTTDTDTDDNDKGEQPPPKPDPRPRTRTIDGMVIVPSQNSFQDTYTNLLAALDSSPVTLMAEVPHSDAAASVELALDPNYLAVFGNPVLGTPVMQQNQAAGLDLPQKMLVWQEESDNEEQPPQVFVGYNQVEYLEFRHADAQKADIPTLGRISGALLNFASAASGVPTEEIVVNDLVDLESTGVITRQSDADFETTWSRLQTVIEASPANLIFQVDHAANAANADLDLPPTRLAVFGNPVLGTPLMQVSPTAGIDLPLKMLVWQDDDGNVNVSTNDIDFIQSRHDIQGADGALNRMKTAVQNFLTAATTTTGPSVR